MSEELLTETAEIEEPNKEKKVKKKKTKKQIILIVVAIFIIILLLTYMVFFAVVHATASEYYDTAEKEFVIPGLGDGFVPRGLVFDEKSELYLICGYMNNGDASRIYIVDPETNEFSYVSLNDVNGKTDATHASGVAIYGRFVFVTNEKFVNVFRLSDVTNPDYDLATPIDKFNSGNSASFCYVNNDNLYIGEFYKKNKIHTPDSHHMQTGAGEYQMSIMMVYDASELTSALSQKGAIDKVLPTAAYSIRDKAQGMVILKGGQICLSSSWMATTSHIGIYDDPMKSNLTSDDEFIMDDGSEIPLYYLDSEHLLKDYALPPLAKSLCLSGNSVLVMNDSASNKYFFGKLIGGKYCYSFIPEY